jgi:hypothetical protein
MFAALAAAVVVAVVSGVRSAQGSTPAPLPVVSQSAVTFHDSMRKLWEDHITWTRNVIISVEVNVPDASVTLPDLSAALVRLFANQVDIGDAIKPYYGNAAGDERTLLLHDHIAIAGDILQDVKIGDSAKYQTDNARWYANAHDIAVFLSGGTVQGSTATLNPPTGSPADPGLCRSTFLPESEPPLGNSPRAGVGGMQCAPAPVTFMFRLLSHEDCSHRSLAHLS